MNLNGEKKTMENDNMQKNDEKVADEHHDPKIIYRGWKLGAIGTLANLVVYLLTVLNLENITATNIINIFSSSCNFATFLGAFLCDTYFGRYKTLEFCTATFFLGLLIIELSAAVKNLHPPHSAKENSISHGPTAGQMAFLFTGLGFLMVGSAGIQPCNLAFGADQFNLNTASGKEGVNSFFNWYFFTFTFAVMVSLTLIVYIQSNVNWALALGILAALMLISCVVDFMGSKIYVKVQATGSPIARAVQVIVVALKKRQLKRPENPLLSLFTHMPPKYLDKAAMMTPQYQINPDGSASDPWNLCSMQQVEEVKCLVRVIPIWIAGIICYLVVQQKTLLVFQALQSLRSIRHNNFQIPAGSFDVFAFLSLTIWLPISERIDVPSLRKVTKKDDGITLLQRIGIGIFLAALSMIVSALVEKHRRTLALRNPIGMQPRKGAISSISGSWFVLQDVLSGLAEAFASVGQDEFFYRQFPEDMRSIEGSKFFCGLAGLNYLSSLLISIVHRITPKSKTGNWLPEDLNKGRLE